MKIFEETIVIVQGGGGGGGGSTDQLSSLNIKGLNDTMATPTDAGAFTLNAAYSDTMTTATEAAQLKFPSGDYSDTMATPTDVATNVIRVWLSGSTSVSQWTNPTNANGQNDGTLAVGQTAPAGATTSQMNSTLGSNVPTVTISTAILRGWFKDANTLVTSSGTIVVHSTSALFADQTIFTNSALNTTVDHTSGDFTYDLIANGINTLAKIQSIQMQFKTSDAAAGVTPNVMSVDAFACDITGAF